MTEWKARRFWTAAAVEPAEPVEAPRAAEAIRVLGTTR